MAEKRKRTSRGGKGGGIVSNVVEQTSRVAEETTRIAGEVLDSATSVANTARETGAEWVKGVSPTAADVIRPSGRKKTKKRAARQPRKTGAGKAAASATRTTNKAAKRTGKAAASATRTATTGRKGGAKKR